MVTSVEERLAKVEKELDALKRLVSKNGESWERTFGMFSGDPEFEEILRRGREIRRAERDDAPE